MNCRFSFKNYAIRFIIVNEKLKTKDECLGFFAKTLKDKGYGKSSETILLKALEREGQFSTGIGEHIAIPHIRDDVMTKPDKS